VEGLQSRNERIKQDSASEIMDRRMGKPTVRVEQDINESNDITVTIKRGDD